MDDKTEEFTQLYHHHAAAVWRQAYRLTDTASAAEDVFAATFLTAWRRFRTGDLVVENVLAWLLVVAGNEVRAEHRRTLRRRRLVEKVGRGTAVRDHSDDVVASLDDQHRLRRVRAALDRLPAGQRAAVELCLLAEVPQAEAARALGVPEATVRSRVHRARARLRTLLPEENP